MSFNIKWIKFPSLSALSPMMAVVRKLRSFLFQFHVFTWVHWSPAVLLWNFGMTFFAWTRSVSFHVVFKDILRYGSASISSYKEYSFTISTHIMVSDQITWRVINDFICIHQRHGRWKLNKCPQTCIIN